MKANLALVILALVLALIGVVLVTQSVSADTVIHVKEGSLGNHQCNADEWHFVITQVSDPALAPVSIHVVWANGNEADVSLFGVTGQTAHYYNYSNLDSPVVDAWTSIYDGWSGEFNLSHGPCFDEPTPTPTNTEAPSATPSNTPTETPTATPTDTATATASPTNTATNTPTATPTKDPSSPTPTATGTQPTATPTETATNSPTPTATQPETPTPTATQPTATPTATQEETPTMTPRPPQPAKAESAAEYNGTLLGTLYMDKHFYHLYQGVNASDGTLALPAGEERGAAQYNNVIWVHRAWNTGWVHLEVGDAVVIMDDNNNTITYYNVESIQQLPYGVYPPEEGFYLATCMSQDGEHWTNVELFKLKLLRISTSKAK